MSLRKLNLSAAILHYTLAVGFSIFFINANKKYVDDPVMGLEFTMRDHSLELKDENDVTVSNWVSKQTVNVDIKLIQSLLIVFFITTGTFHLMYYFGQKEPANLENPTINNFYSNAIQNQNNFYRWIEYGITATIMLYVIAFVSGVKDTNIYILLFGISVTMISLGQTIEVAIRDGKDWKLPMITSFLLLFSAFIVIARSFWTRLSEVNKYLDEKPLDEGKIKELLPTWLNYMIIILFVFYSCFGIISLVGAVKHTQYDKIEKAYIVLSFVSKATLAGFVAYGTGRQNNAQE